MSKEEEWHTIAWYHIALDSIAAAGVDDCCGVATVVAQNTSHAVLLKELNQADGCCHGLTHH